MIRSFRGKTPTVAESAFVSEAAYVIGDVEIGEESSIWPGAIIRGDFTPIKIGNNSQVVDGSIIHSGENLQIGDNVHIGHGVVVHCRWIGNNVLIGNNATLLEDVEIGIAASSPPIPWYAEGRAYQIGAFFSGNPAKARGDVTEEQLKSMELGVSTYTELAREYKREGL